MTHMTVLALDPGGETGWASYQAIKMVNDEGVAEFYDEVWRFGVLGPARHHRQLEDLLEIAETEVYHIVAESFQDRVEKQTAVDLQARDYLGVIDAWGLRNDQRIHHQTANMAKGFVDDKKLKVMDLWSGSRHSRDATRHAILFMVTQLQMTQLVHPWRDLV